MYISSLKLQFYLSISYQLLFSTKKILVPRSSTQMYSANFTIYYTLYYLPVPLYTLSH